MLDFVGKLHVCINCITGLSPLLQNDAALLGSKDKCKKMEDVPRLNLGHFLFCKTIFNLI